METALLIFIMALIGLVHLVVFLAPFVALGAGMYFVARVL